MKKLLASILSLAVVAGLGFSVATAQEGEQPAAGGEAEHEAATPHYPIHHPKEQDWSFAGPFGKYDKGQLQRGLKVYTEVCAACHSMSLVSFRTLEGLGYSEAQVKTFAANYEVEDGPNADGEMFTRTAIASDHFPSPFPNQEAAAASNNGAAPPDFSLIAKARGITRGFPQFVFDIFTQYQEGGPDYIYSLLTGYQDPPAGVEVAAGTHYNPYFANAAALAMAPPLSDGQVTYDDGSPETLDQYAHDVSAFLMWAAEPHLEERKRTGFMVMVFLVIFTGLIYLTKKSVYASKEH
ncbi:MAG: cytochrome c1 [Shinella sp.]|nr:cytochrome c1 [Shinella sp.]